MCCIYGIAYNKGYSNDVLENKMFRMSEIMKHRGPDDKEIIFLDNIAIGMNRLSIIGPNDKNAMVQKVGEHYSVFNGEITNYKELSKEFSKDVNCDSEIILPMYNKYGNNFVKKLGGMFAIAIYDNANDKISLWRDALGVKPLYYYSNNEYFIFASEIKAIYAILEKKPQLNFNAIDNILRYGFNPGETTVFDGIKKVLPGEMVSFCDGKIEKQKFWNLKKNIKNELQNEKEKIEEFRLLLNKIIEENSYSDVPGGFFLSGGLDSSLVTAISLQNKESNYRVPISIRFLPNEVDDQKYVTILEKYFNKKVEWVEITPQIARDTLFDLIQYLDEPLENATHVGTYLMAKRAKELGLKTIITGDGSDELFIGYERQECWIKNKNAKEIYPSLTWRIPKKGIEILYNKDILEMIKDNKYLPETVSNISDALLYERGERLPEYHNMRLDRMTMAHSIEAKVPFQDYRIADYSFNLSIEELMQGTRKGWLKEISKKWLPEEIIYRKKSIFPSLPNEWISGKGVEWAKEILLDSQSKTSFYFNQKELEKMIEEHALNRVKHGKELWALIVLELWLKNIENWK